MTVPGIGGVVKGMDRGGWISEILRKQNFLWELRVQEESSRMASRFLVWITGYTVLPFTDIKNKEARKGLGAM